MCIRDSYVPTCSALCGGNSNQINNGKTNDLSESPKNDAGSKCIINTEECPERIIAHYNIDVAKSCLILIHVRGKTNNLKPLKS